MKSAFWGRHEGDPPQAAASLALAMEVAGYFELKDGKAGEIAGQAGKAVSKRRDDAARRGLTKAEIERMASAFEHGDQKARRAAQSEENNTSSPATQHAELIVFMP